MQHSVEHINLCAIVQKKERSNESHKQTGEFPQTFKTTKSTNNILQYCSLHIICNEISRKVMKTQGNMGSHLSSRVRKHSTRKSLGERKQKIFSQSCCSLYIKPVGRRDCSVNSFYRIAQFNQFPREYSCFGNSDTLEHRGCHQTPAGAQFHVTIFTYFFSLPWLCSYMAGARSWKTSVVLGTGGDYIIACGLFTKTIFGRYIVFEGRLGDIFLLCTHFSLANRTISMDLL